MADLERPVGEFFSRVYVERGAPTFDSKRFRIRMVAFLRRRFLTSWTLHGLRIANLLEEEFGILVSNQNATFFDYQTFIKQADTSTLLDFITVCWRCFDAYASDGSADEWYSFVNRAMREENVAYRIDEKGGVHYKTDEEFERNRASTVAALGAARYNAVRSEFEKAFGHLDRREGKEAIRAAWEAIETLAKLMVGEKMARLGPTEVEKHLKPLAQSVYVNGTPQGNAASQLLTGLSGWINAAHQYRHGQRIEEPAPPPLELAVAMVSTGASYLRWLAEIDQQIEN